MNGNFLDLESVNEDCLKNRSNNIPPSYANANSNRQNNNSNSESNNKLLAFNNDLTNRANKILSFERKNTSDSNMKLLADHNFYHITHRRDKHHFRNQNGNMKENFFNNDPISESSSPNSVSSLVSNAIQNFNQLSAKNGSDSNSNFSYSTKLSSAKFKQQRSGLLNSSSNSLLSLNSSSAGTSEDSATAASATTPSSTSNLVRSNPDLKLNQANSPHNNSKSSFHNELKNLSNNFSLNLSMHTAEEFGIEMLEWLNNETCSNNKNKDMKLANNATLV